MPSATFAGFHLAGLKLKDKTTNANGRSGIDCGNHWQAFEKGNYAERIHEKVNDDIYAVYFEYEGDHTQPYSYFIGCLVKEAASVPGDMDHLFIPAGEYRHIVARGTMPDCVAGEWKKIWKSDLERGYRYDFEVYDERSRDWSDATVDIYLS
ncbi:GyrI-like domain-containing protein [Sediminibacterium ginsengisoli]|uniref:Predicted transcriptional regulator YdeE, contains AraC-type DNA-binding domain n=1 Tax=Sediminibacterium ginsengisoli TaxID=413434 RepID=A0A1T4QAT0_9BACT|nr:effector binding domain-containing protein [Sediminibacterium ginsengisoli]SKA00882.1 Predicted transcriptional regulator YdeE, contains AraC-type DNA-binding domain [Sediminibacterium ginsengisoli]